MKEPLMIKMINIHKNFGGVQALRGVDFSIGGNEVVGLVGDNGAGKSTLVKIISGVFPPDKGEMYFEGKKVNLSAPRDAMRLGIETVYQGQALVPQLGMERNIFLGRELTRRMGFLKIKEMRKKSVDIMESIGLHNIGSPEKPVEYLSGGQRQGVAIARAMYFKAKLLILDEPTMALSIKESQQILELVRRVKARGASCIFISHNLYHVYPVVDRLVVLRRGKKVGDVKKENTSINDLTKLITSETISE